MKIAVLGFMAIWMMGSIVPYIGLMFVLCFIWVKIKG